MIIIINGKGTSGKDTVINWIDGFLKKDNIRVNNYSSIDPTRMAASIFDCHNKTDKDRLFLKKLKDLSIWYNDHPTKYLLKLIKNRLSTRKSYIKKCKNFESDGDLFFLHIREPEEIDKMKKLLMSEGFKVYTLLIDRKIDKVFGNDADDNVLNYNYDFVIDNSNDFEYTKPKIIELLKEINVYESKYIE